MGTKHSSCPGVGVIGASGVSGDDDQPTQSNTCARDRTLAAASAKRDSARSAALAASASAWRTCDSWRLSFDTQQEEAQENEQEGTRKKAEEEDKQAGADPMRRGLEERPRGRRQTPA